MVTLNKCIDISVQWLIYILSAIVIYMLILKLTDHSPIFEAVIATGLGIIAGIIYKQGNRLSRIEALMETHIALTKNTFGRIWHELDEIKREVKRIPLIEERLRNMEKRLDSTDGRLARIERKLGA